MNIAKNLILIKDAWLSGILLKEPKLLFFDLSTHGTRILIWTSVSEIYASPDEKARRLPSYIIIPRFKQI